MIIRSPLLKTLSIKQIHLNTINKSVLKEIPEEFKAHTQFDPTAEFPNPKHLLLKQGREKFVGAWLLACAGGVFFMVLVGGYTRLTHSGLSMTKWKPIEYSYPKNQEEWEKEYEHYKLFPEYEHNQISLQGFKSIYNVEYFHRVSGSTLGAMYTLPLVLFNSIGWITPQYAKRLYLIGGLGLMQGLIGWWMVKSGLDQPKPAYQQAPRVSTYRLIVHLSMATVLYSFLLHNSLTCFRQPQYKCVTPENFQNIKTMKRLGLILVHCVAFNLISGAAVAGIDAGKVYNTWPLMNGAVVPNGISRFEPFYKNFFENMAMVQFNHRNAAYLTYTVSAYTAYKAVTLNLPRSTKFAALTVFALCNYQLVNGVVMLLRQVPVHDGSIHQWNAMNVLTATLILLHTTRRPHKGFEKYLQQFK